MLYMLAELRQLKSQIKRLTLENKSLRKSITMSNTAKNGYIEEHNLSFMMNYNDEFRKLLCEKTNKTYTSFTVSNDLSKTDIVSDTSIRMQVKKYTKNRFQQVDRHWVSSLTKSIPNLVSIQDILVKWLHIPLIDNKKIDKTKPKVKLSTAFYEQKELDLLIKVLNENKNSILSYAFEGTEDCHKPEYLATVEHKNKVRHAISIYRISDVINYLMLYDFEITKGKTVISLGKTFSLQRKGGDSGRKSSNQLQMKINIGKINEDLKLLHYEIKN